MRVDLHLHSCFSDGDKTPEQLISQAKSLSLDAVSLTDHDTTDGVDRFLAAAKGKQIEALPGVELSSERHKEVHVLGYGMDYHLPRFQERIREIKEMRNDRNLKILKVLKKYKVFLSEEDIAPKTGETIGRMHIAKAMKRKGYVSTIGEAFDYYLGFGKKAYVPSCRITPEKAVGMIAEAGGAAVLAHPYRLLLGEADLRALVRELMEYGLQGIEAYYCSHNEQETRTLLKIASDYRLTVTCGSDYHGDNKANTMGCVEADIPRLP